MSQCDLPSPSSSNIDLHSTFDSGCCGLSSTSEYKGQNEPGNKPADVRHVSYTPTFGGVRYRPDSADELQHDPDAYHRKRGHWYYAASHQYVDSAFREQQDVCAKNSGNRARRAEIWNIRVGAKCHLRKRRGEPAQKIKDQKLDVTET